MCDRKVLLFSMVLYLVLVVYEFFVSISPVPRKPSWKFMNIETTANSLSRSNYFNLFVIFFDAMIISTIRCESIKVRDVGKET